MTTANREYEALTTVEAVQKAFADGREVEYRTWSDRKWARAPSAIGVASDFIRGWEYRAPAASVGDAPSDAVAWQTRLTYPGGMVGGWDNAETEELADRRVTSIRELGDDRYSIEKRALYTAPPAAPVVSSEFGAFYVCPKCHGTGNVTEAALSVPATDDKAPAVDAESALAMLVDLIVPGLDSGDIFADVEVAVRALNAGSNPGGAKLTTTYIQDVPDKCDRIIWRGHYFHLPQSMGGNVTPQVAAPTSPHDVEG